MSALPPLTPVTRAAFDTVATAVFDDCQGCRRRKGSAPEEASPDPGRRLVDQSGDGPNSVKPYCGPSSPIRWMRCSSLGAVPLTGRP